MEKIHQRISKLLALGESENIHEAANALAQAQALMDKYRIANVINNETSQGEIQLDSRITCFEFNKIIPKWKWSLLWAIARPNNCKPWANREEQPSKAYFVGFEEDVIHATAMYKYIEVKVEKLACCYSQTSPGRAAKDSFRKGAVAEVKLRLQEHKASTMQSLNENIGQTKVESALQVISETAGLVERKMLENSMGYHSPVKVRRSDAQAFADGVRAGKSIKLKGSNKELGS